MQSTSLQKNIIQIVMLFLCILSILIGIICYDKLTYKLDVIQNSNAILGETTHIIDQIDLKGITLIGVLDDVHGYRVIGFIKSPISSHYKAEPIEYFVESYNKNGLICMLTPGLFTYKFSLYEATNENVNSLNMLNPYYFIFLGITNDGYKLGVANEDVRVSSRPILKIQLVPYIAIFQAFTLFWFILYVIIIKKKFKKALSP